MHEQAASQPAKHTHTHTHTHTKPHNHTHTQNQAGSQERRKWLTQLHIDTNTQEQSEARERGSTHQCSWARAHSYTDLHVSTRADAQKRFG